MSRSVCHATRTTLYKVFWSHKLIQPLTAKIPHHQGEHLRVEQEVVAGVGLNTQKIPPLT